MDELKIVVIGGVACGPKAATRARRCNPKAKITLVEKGDWLSYGGCGLPYYLGSVVKELKDLMATSWEAVRTPAFFKYAKDIDVLLGWEAVKIDRDNKQVILKRTDNGESKVLPYDKLVLATGAEPWTPPIEGKELQGVFGLKTPQDAMDIKDFLLNNAVEKVIVVGAGLIGLEAGEAFANWGMEVTFVEMQDQVLPLLLDRDMAQVLEKYLTEEGLTVYTGTKVEKIVGQDGKVQGVQTDKGFLEGQLVLIATGVRPSIKLAQEAGLVTERGIVVNEYLQTSDPDIYAGGDCVVCTQRISGEKVYVPLGSTANKQGRIIGTNITGGQEVFPGVLGTSIFKIFDWNVGRTGLSEKQARELGYEAVAAIVPGPDKAHFFPGKKLMMTKLIAEQKTGKILGAQLIGPGDIARRLDVVVTAISFGATAHDLANLDLAYAPPFSPAMDNIINVANAVKNIIDGKAKYIDFEEFKARLHDDQVVYLDLRTDEERKQKEIKAKNLLHIPFEQLRQRINEVPEDKEIFVFCILSTRAYEAALTLNQAGFEKARYIQGGIQFWPLDK